MSRPALPPRVPARVVRGGTSGLKAGREFPAEAPVSFCSLILPSEVVKRLEGLTDDLQLRPLSLRSWLPLAAKCPQNESCDQKDENNGDDD